jgi:hypothetical protein
MQFRVSDLAPKGSTLLTWSLAASIDNIRLEMERTLGLPKEEWVGDGNPTKDEKWVSKKPTRRSTTFVLRWRGHWDCRKKNG